MPFPHVLVVEDDEDLRLSLVDILEEEGHGVLAAENGERALELLAWGEPPSLILLDLMMPVMDGWEFLRQVRADPRLARVPVVVVSALAKDAPDDATFTISKPLALDDLLRLLRVVEGYADPVPPAP